MKNEKYTLVVSSFDDDKSAEEWLYSRKIFGWNLSDTLDTT